MFSKISHKKILRYVLSWVPDNRDAIHSAESSRMTEVLFKATMDAHGRDCGDVADEMAKMLTVWAFKGGKHHLGWGTLGRALIGSAVIVVARGHYSLDSTILKQEIRQRLAGSDVPDQSARANAARDIREEIRNPRRRTFTHSDIERTAAVVDQTQLTQILNEIIELVVPPPAAPTTATPSADNNSSPAGNS